jgi:hypothetical protein
MGSGKRRLMELAALNHGVVEHVQHGPASRLVAVGHHQDRAGDVQARSRSPTSRSVTTVAFSLAPSARASGTLAPPMVMPSATRRCARLPGSHQPAAPPGRRRSGPGRGARPGHARWLRRTGARPRTWRSPARRPGPGCRPAPARPDSGARRAWQPSAPAPAR